MKEKSTQTIFKTNPPTHESVAYQSRGTFRAFETLASRLMGEIGVQLSHFHVLRTLWEHDGATQNFISRETFITDSSTAQVISEMERHGLLERRMDSNDKRKRCIFLKPKGADLQEKLTDVSRTTLNIAVQGLTKADIKAYNRISEQIRENIMNEYKRKYDKKRK